LISQEDAAALVVVDVAQALAVRGYEPVITHENGPRLVRLGEQMLAEFGIGGETAEENGG
jgi:carbamate kinase